MTPTAGPPTNTPTPAPPTNTPTRTLTPTITLTPTVTNTPIPVNCPCTIWPSSATPGNPSNNDSNAVEVGVKFRSDSSGYITGVRFYKGAGNTGTHIGNLWTSTGTLLGSATFSGETATGWQQVTFATPLAITANTTYVASYHMDAGHYAGDLNGLASNVDNAPLHALSSASSGGNGLYAYSATSTFPTNTFTASNYWVDVVFVQTLGPTSTPTMTPTAGPPTNTPTPAPPTNTPTNTLTPTRTPTPPPLSCPCTIWPAAAAPANPAQGDTNSVEIGVKFRSDYSGTITGLRFYKGAGNTGTHVGTLWTSGGVVLAQATFTNETASGWQQVTFASPVAITPNTTYVASYHAPVGRYAADQNGLATNVDNVPLHALSSATSGGNGVYAYGATSVFPTNTFNATNYWVDVVYAP